MKKMNRRRFLKFQFNGLLYLAGGSFLFPYGAAIAAGNPDLAVVKGSPEAAVSKAVDLLGGMGRFVKKGDRVVIKPNMSFAVPPEWGANTHPLVVRRLMRMCLDAGASRVSVLDNPLAPDEQCLEKSGIVEACDSLDPGRVHMLSVPSMFSSVDISGARKLKKTDVMKEVLAADVLIAAPVAKSHAATGVSLSMKGMMGLIYDRRTLHRLDLNASIVDLASALKPKLVLIDATRVLSTNGPHGPGKVLTPNTVIAGTDMVAADAYTVSAFEWYGRHYRPDQVKHIRLAHERGLGRMDIDHLKIRKTSV